MKKASIFALSAATLLLASCSSFNSHWTANMFIHSNNSHSAYMEFGEFDGLIVFDLRANDSNGMNLKYDLSLGEGSFTISYAYSEEKDDQGEIVKIADGEKKEDTFTLPKEGVFHLLVESEGKAKTGNFHFDLTK